MKFQRYEDPKKSLKIGVLAESKELLERSLSFINWIKRLAKFDDEGLDEDIKKYLDKMK